MPGGRANLAASFLGEFPEAGPYRRICRAHFGSIGKSSLTWIVSEFTNLPALLTSTKEFRQSRDFASNHIRAAEPPSSPPYGRIGDCRIEGHQRSIYKGKSEGDFFQIRCEPNRCTYRLKTFGRQRYKGGACWFRVAHACV